MPEQRHDSRYAYIDGRWLAASDRATLDVVDPSTEAAIATIGLSTPDDVDVAVAAARAAFPAFAATSPEERIALLERIIAGYERRAGELASTLTREMGAPARFAAAAQVPSGLAHLRQAVKVLRDYRFTRQQGRTRILREPIGVCALITPWNWPLNQIACKVAPALAAGCTMVLKPSEVAPLNALLFAEVLHEAGVPAGVFNMVPGDGPTVGEALARHPAVDMVSFTGSTRAGIEVARAAAPTVKRVTQELGGKSANILLDDADFAAAVKAGVRSCMANAGQSCNAPTRMLVPRHRMDEVATLAAAAAGSIVQGDPSSTDTVLGPVVNARQFARVQALIQQGIDEGARLVAGGPGRPAELPVGYFVRPTVFADVHNGMTIAREEIFGPVLCILAYDSEDEAVAIANDTPYGLSGYVWSGDPERAFAVAARLRTGNVHLNGAPSDISAPFGGYKQSGNGREWGLFGFEEFLEVKAVMGCPEPS